MVIDSNIKAKIQNELINSKSVWIASAMISYSGWSFLQKNISNTTDQFYLIGIDLSTDPKVFESILKNLEINAKVYETEYTFHPKVYLIKRNDNSFTAFIGSSNTTSWGLEKNVEMNFQINDQRECKKILNWFNSLYSEGYLITQSFLNNYKLRFVRANIKRKEIIKETTFVKTILTQNQGQFFSRNQHEIFNKKYHRINSENLRNIRKEVRGRFIELHKSIYPQFANYGLSDLHCHHQNREIVSRHFFNQFSGNYINAMWLHYGKSLTHLQKYKNADISINKPDSFINNIRMQVIIRENIVGIWLVLGRNNGSRIDRKHFQNQLRNKKNITLFFNQLKKLDDAYWLRYDEGYGVKINEIETIKNLEEVVSKETLGEYFIIGKDYANNDPALSDTNIENTVLSQFEMLYPLYEIMVEV